MPPKSKVKLDLGESWEDVDNSQDVEDIYSNEEEKGEMGSQYKSSQTDEDTVSSEDEERLTRSRSSALKKSARVADSEKETPRRRRVTRFETEPELVMPRSPDAGRDAKNSRLRAQTPHFRLNQRSLTSDAGTLRRLMVHKKKLTRYTGTIRRQTEQKKSKEPENELSLWDSFIKPTISYFLNVIGLALNFQIVKYVFALWMVVGAVFMARNFATNSINHALSPLCRIPLVRWYGASFCADYQAVAIGGHAEFDNLMAAQSQFHELLSSTPDGAMLSLDMKRSEAGIRDVRVVVQYSSLPSKNELVFEFNGFIDTARQASDDLSSFNVHIGGAVDRILSNNKWTLKVIQGLADADANRGSIATFLSKNLNIFAPFQPLALRQDALLDQYLRHTSFIEEQVNKLISEAQVLLDLLKNMDDRLDVIAGIATRDGIVVKEGRDALLTDLWTMLGGNRNTVQRMDNQLNLLHEVGAYRKLAWAHVSATITKLQAIRHQLEDLRERATMPEAVSGQIPLETHIEHMNLGIERLENERDASRKIMDADRNRVLQKIDRVFNSKLIE